MEATGARQHGHQKPFFKLNVVIPDAWIIEEILRRERQRKERERKYPEEPAHLPPAGSDPAEEWLPKESDPSQTNKEHQVVIVDL